MKKISAVEWLAKNLKDIPHVKHSYLFKYLVEQAKQMEREQIIDANDSGFADGVTHEADGKMRFKTSEQYYNKTYGEQDSEQTD
jgi:hypothetical protein